MSEARSLASEGKFEEALQKHVWFHNHALELRPSYYGVRLSFALADWVELGKSYPKALTILRSIRDEKARRLIAGEKRRDLFHDVESINDHLGEMNATVDLFKRLEAVEPEFTSSVYDLADEALVAAGEYALARKFMGDPADRFANARGQFAEGMQFAKRARQDDAAKEAFESIFVAEVIRIITVLGKTSELDKAKEIQSKALVVFDSPEIRSALGQ